jgi:POT family proton-dependent oligopeptide transporter
LSDEPRWFGQPRGLTILCLTSMWEQFSYFGMRALLIYYMTKHLMLSQETSSLVYGAYTSCVYFTPILGGLVADRLLGNRLAIILGASIMASGHAMMTSESLFYPALVTIAVGNGLFLPSLPAQIDDLYEPDDPRRPWAFNVYYVGVNVGAFLAPVVCGSLGEIYGWSYGFGAAGIGMLIGLAVYLSGRAYLPQERTRGPEEPQPAVNLRMAPRAILLLAGVALSVTLFRAAYEQVGNTVALWIDSSVDRAAGGFVIPNTWFQSLNALFVIAFTQPLLTVWRRQADAGREQRLMRRMSAGALIVCGSYVLLAAVAWLSDGASTAWPWLVAFFVVLTVGELFILPTGLSVFARLAPPGLGATIVAAWYLTIFSGSLSAGLVGTLWSSIPHAAFFALLALLAAAAALCLRLLDKPMRRLDAVNVETLAAADA